MVFDRFILYEASKKGYHIVLFGSHLGLLWYALPSGEALLFTGYTIIGYAIYIIMMILLYITGQFGNEYAVPFRKQLSHLFPLLRVIVEE